MRREQEQTITNRIEPVLTGVQILELQKPSLREYTFQPMRGEQEQIIPNRIEPVLTGVKVLKLEALLDRVYFSTNEKRAGADYTFQPMRRKQEQIILFN
jgi:predicted RNA-binding protein